MKRISIFTIALLLVTAGTTMANPHYRGPSYRRVHWSFEAHGLVSNEFYYNPYARGYGGTGLVPYWIRYSPYAHGIHHPSGLVDDYAWYTDSVYYRPENYFYNGLYVINCDHKQADMDSGHEKADARQTRKNYLAKIDARREELCKLAQARKQQRLDNMSSGKETIVTYLKGKNIDFRMSRMLSIEGKVLSADFVVGDGHTVISYWDPVEIQTLDGQPEFRKLLYQNYVNSWKSFCAQHQRAGGEIFQIVSTDREEILAQLTVHDELNDPQTLYAMAQTPSQ